VHFISTSVSGHIIFNLKHCFSCHLLKDSFGLLGGVHGDGLDFGIFERGACQEHGDTIDISKPDTFKASPLSSKYYVKEASVISKSAPTTYRAFIFWLIMFSPLGISKRSDFCQHTILHLV
jgi:hypothetical protein